MARLIDTLVLGIVFFYFVFAKLAQEMDEVTIDEHGGISEGRGAVATFALAFLSLAVMALCYEVSLVALRGGTLGKLFMGIRVVRSRDGGLPGWGPAIVRWVVPLLSCVMTFGLGGVFVFLSPFFDHGRRNQGWHDQAASTIVINV